MLNTKNTHRKIRITKNKHYISSTKAYNLAKTHGKAVTLKKMNISLSRGRKKLVKIKKWRGNWYALPAV